MNLLRIDFSASGTVDFQEFLSLIVPTKSETNRNDELMRAFEAFDKDGNGYISKEELREGLQILGEKVTEEELRELLNIVDSDNDGEIRYSGAV